MRIPSELYHPSLALLTDLYELTMAYGYFKAGLAEREAVFHLSYRKNPFQGGYAVACGLEWVIDLLSALRFEEDDLRYLGGLEGIDRQPLFEPAFLDHLRGFRFRCDLDAVPEGTVVFPHEPLLRVRGPLLQSQLCEALLLNLVNFQTLVATKAARICQAADGDPVLEFGLRRAQGIDGALAASRAAYIGGCAATSNVLAGRLFDIPVRGTHAHSWVMIFADEREAFRSYAQAMPNNCIFLVDTYNTLDGIKHAIEIGRLLRQQGKELLGVRLDSGDLAYFSIQARQLLDEAGFSQAAILASNDLDEGIIASLKNQGAKITVWGVGTKLVTAFDEPALGGVYKLAAIRDEAGSWQYKVKISEQAIKTSTPGQLQVRRYLRQGAPFSDVIYDQELGLPAQVTMIDPMDFTRRRSLPPQLAHQDLLVPVFRQGERCYSPPPLREVRAYAATNLARFHAGVRRFVHPHRFPVGIEQQLNELKLKLILTARGYED